MNVNTAAWRNQTDASSLDLVHANLLRFFPDLVRALGGDPETLLRRVGLDAIALAKDEPALSCRSWVTLLEHAATELRCRDFGLRLARLQGGRNVFGPISLVMKNSRTFGEAIEYVANHMHAHSLAARMKLERDRATDSMFVGHEILLAGLPNQRQAIEQIMLLGHLIALESTGGQARVREVRFRHQPLSPRAAYRHYFGAPVCFDSPEDGVIFSAHDLGAPIVDGDSRLYALATSLIDMRFAHVRPPLETQVRALLVRLIETADCSIERVCSELGLHPRTLHRRLKAEGTSFDDIKDIVRRDTALRYLQETDHSFTFIAGKLGYAEQSVLTRSCNRWFAAAPSTLRLLSSSVKH